MQRDLPQHRALWLAYLGVAAAAVLWWPLEFALLADSPDVALGLLGFVIGCIGLVPLVGFVRQYAYRPLWLWRTFFWVGVLFFSAAMAGTALQASVLTATEWAWGLGNLAIVFLYLFALNEYVSKSPHLWQT